MTNLQDRIDAVHAKQQADASRIRNRRDLTPQAKRQRLRDIDDEARKAMAELQTSATAEAEGDRRTAHRNAFGLTDLPGGASANSFAFRQAQQRVAGVMSSREAAELYADAESFGDEILARAVASHALGMQSSPLAGMDPGWVNLLNDYVAARPNKVADVQALLDANHPVTAADLFTFAVPPSGDAA